ncbi:MAG TPA: rod shape-determining protein MreD [Vicinamibacterales bacterium]|nr:rod shape-determining protein MreD [Vicinamibacterales bacterium]
MKVIAVLAALVVALLFQTTLAGMSLEAGTRVNFVLVAVVYVALALGPLAGLLAGAAGGLVQDAVAGSIVGIGGISKTLAGFLVGVLGAQFIVSQPVPRFVMFVGATMVHELCFQSLYALVEGQPVRFIWGTLLVQAAVNGGIGLLAFQLVEGAPRWRQRRYARRSATLSRRRF